MSGSANPTSILMNANKSVTAVFVQAFTLTTTVSGSGSGSIAPSGGTYAAGTPLSLTPTAAPGSRFDHWEGALSGSEIPAPLIMDANKSVTAVFVRQYTLNISVSGTGNGSVSPAGGTYDAGAQVTLTAAAVSGSRFVLWEGDFSGTNSAATFTINAATFTINADTFTINADMNVTAVFDLITYTLTTGVLGEGSMLPPIGTYTYNEGTQVLLFPLPDPGWRFDHWEGGLGGNLDPGILIMNSDKTVTAVFVPVPCTLTVSATGPGTVSPGTSTYNIGDTATQTATANANAQFEYWIGEGNDSAGNPVNLNANSSISVPMDYSRSLTAVFGPLSALIVEGGGTGWFTGSHAPVSLSQIGINHTTLTEKSVSQVQAELASYRIFAFNGHGSPGVLIINDENEILLTYDDVAAALSDDAIRYKLVYLNSCSSAQSYTSKWLSAFHCDVLVGWSNTVGGKTAEAFDYWFWYYAVQQGVSITTAVNNAWNNEYVILRRTFDGEPGEPWVVGNGGLILHP